MHKAPGTVTSTLVPTLADSISQTVRYLIPNHTFSPIYTILLLLIVCSVIELDLFKIPLGDIYMLFLYICV